MPKTPPLLLPSNPSFQYTSHDTLQSLMLDYSPQDSLSARSHHLSSVAEEHDEEDQDNNLEFYSYQTSSQQQSPESPSINRYQHDTIHTTIGNYQFANDMRPLTSIAHPLDSSQPLPGKRQHEEEEEEEGDAYNLDYVYQELILRHGYIKDALETQITHLGQAEMDTRSAVEELLSYETAMESQYHAVHQRWLQIQTHSQNIFDSINNH
ncbi:hypothetical protein BC941DRAFT_447125 [Chlamydoabsidia padenii]|nr:hypothetical protein BC941DRAFT_447125 [Chlamydoabsidia padenii]